MSDPSAGEGEEPWRNERSEAGGALGWTVLYARLALSAGFLSAVADRLGLWGPPGGEGVAWGSFDAFLGYTGTLVPYLADAWLPALGWSVTAAEVVVAAMLLAGWKTRWAATGAGALLLAFALGMTLGTGVKSALDASVYAASAGAFLLAGIGRGGGVLSVDRLRAD